MNSTKRLIFCLSILALLTGCADFKSAMTTATSTGPGANAETAANPGSVTSESISIPLNFALASKRTKSLRPHASSLTESDMRDFLSIGTRRLSQLYAIEAASWQIQFRDNLKQSSVADYQVTANLESPVSRELQRETATSQQQALLALDSEADEHYVYRTHFRATVRAILRSEMPDTIFFDTTLSLTVKRKHRRAADQLLKTFGHIDERAKDRLALEIRREIFEAYAQLFENLGVDLQRKRLPRN